MMTHDCHRVRAMSSGADGGQIVEHVTNLAHNAENFLNFQRFARYDAFLFAFKKQNRVNLLLPTTFVVFA